MKYAFWIVVFAALLSACGEKPQTLGTGKDASPYTGTGKVFADGGWKEGDKGSWESHMKVRTQQGQNDYGRIN
jgi:major membrane immunogen (membrane-anchored lipoprotein)